MNFYKDLIAIRCANLALLDGSYEEVNNTSPNVIAFIRKTTRQTVLIALNMSDKSGQLLVDPGGIGIGKSHRDLLVERGEISSVTGKLAVKLDAYGIYIGDVTPSQPRR